MIEIERRFIWSSLWWQNPGWPLLDQRRRGFPPKGLANADISALAWLGQRHPHGRNAPSGSFWPPRVLLVGHSSGAVLRTLYAKAHPEKISDLVGSGRRIKRGARWWPGARL